MDNRLIYRDYFPSAEVGGFDDGLFLSGFQIWQRLFFICHINFCLELKFLNIFVESLNRLFLGGISFLSLPLRVARIETKLKYKSLLFKCSPHGERGSNLSMAAKIGLRF